MILHPYAEDYGNILKLITIQWTRLSTTLTYILILLLSDLITVCKYLQTVMTSGQEDFTYTLEEHTEKHQGFLDAVSDFRINPGIGFINLSN